MVAQGSAPSANQRPEESAESAWLEAYPAPLPPPLHKAPPSQNASPGATHGVRISGGVMAGQVLTRVDPVYPAEARQNHVTGMVVMVATVGPDGTVQNLEPLSGPEVLRAAALQAVHQWTYRPYLLNGNPVTVQTTVTVNFQPPAPGQP